MKQVIDLDGNEVTVADNTPCHSGKNGGLPRMYSPEELAIIDAEQAAAQAILDAEAPVRNAKAEIARLEGEVTQRRLRDAILTTEGKAWLTTHEAKIATERNKLGE
jgi:hypothetical protein